MRSRGGDILQVLARQSSVRLALSLGRPARPKNRSSISWTPLTRGVFGVVAILMRFAPIGAFGAMAFTYRQIRVGFLGSFP